MTRGTFANVRIKNLMVPGVEGGVTVRQPSGERTTIYDASISYQKEGVPLVVFAGHEYGTGSSRDWAGEGHAAPRRQGGGGARASSASIAATWSDGRPPVPVPRRVSAASLRLVGTETFDVIGLEKPGFRPQQDVTLVVHRADGNARGRFAVRVRIDTPIEIEYYLLRGILPYVLRQLVTATFEGGERAAHARVSPPFSRCAPPRTRARGCAGVCSAASRVAPGRETMRYLRDESCPTSTSDGRFCDFADAFRSRRSSSDMPSTNGFLQRPCAGPARIDWLMHRLEAIDARLVALEVRAARAGKRPPSRAAQLANPAGREDPLAARPLGLAQAARTLTERAASNVGSTLASAQAATRPTTKAIPRRNRPSTDRSVALHPAALESDPASGDGSLHGLASG
jgi:hypothetical protein